jgi:hypothetical protein
VLSSHIHVAWALSAGGRLGVGNDPRYNKSRCFETFPFPDATEEQKTRIREIAERLDAHRKRQLALHPTLTMTDMYNVLDGSRGRSPGGTASTPSAAAGVEPGPPTQRTPLTPKQRAEEESRGTVRYLRPAYQQPHVVPASAGSAAVQSDLGLPNPEPRTLAPDASPLPWPAALADQIALVRGVIRQTAWQPADGAKALVRHFTGVRAPKVQRLVDALTALGQVG